MHFLSISRSSIFILLFLAASLSGCVVLDQVKENLSHSSSQNQTATECKELDPLLADSLQYATQLGQMSEEEREKNVAGLRRIARDNLTPRDRLSMALLALFTDERTLSASEGLSFLANFDDIQTEQSEELAGLVAYLRHSLVTLADSQDRLTSLHIKMSSELAKERTENKNLQGVNKKLQNDLTAEKQKSQEMAQKLQKVLEIEKIMEKRK